MTVIEPSVPASVDNSLSRNFVKEQPRSQSSKSSQHSVGSLCWQFVSCVIWENRSRTLQTHQGFSASCFLARC